MKEGKKNLRMQAGCAVGFDAGLSESLLSEQKGVGAPGRRRGVGCVSPLRVCHSVVPPTTQPSPLCKAPPSEAWSTASSPPAADSSKKYLTYSTGDMERGKKYLKARPIASVG